MLLLKRDGLGQDVEASTHQIDVADLVVPHDAVNSLIVVTADRRSEVDLDSHKGVGLDDSFSHRETENIEAIADELEADRQIAVVLHREQTVGRAVVLNLTERDGACR